MSDSFDFKMVGVPVNLCLDVAFSNGNINTIGWKEIKVDELPTLVLYSYDDGNSILFPTPLNAKEVQPIVEKWLEKVDYGKEPDHDGFNERGFFAFKPKHWSGIICVQPTWLMYGK